MELLNSLWQVLVAVSGLLNVLLALLLPWMPLFAWVAFWLLAVNWKQLYPVLQRGGWIGVVLTMLVAIFAWTAIAIPAGGQHHLFGLHVDNMFGKTVYVCGLTMIAFLCGTFQLSGGCDRWLRFEPEAANSEAPGQSH
ncbi:hypothetical protein [Planctomicrobium piriforme]|uniref:Uncharacterized protein n=1 Tax=Planctomicrobium piriforme TaxID=1576369 RepID=A0A1I3HEQ9_9PLAN|nr:hypothetical protein [Planctomicrobium piriforme]SFI34153.1 hypothetical protein SAMN05421753_10830 [Planctomicrobium piriforme]